MKDFDKEPGIREAGVVTIATEDGPVTALSYRCDFRAEEEWGVAELRKALLASSARRSFQRREAAKNPDYPNPRKRHSQVDHLRVTDDYVAIFVNAEPYRPEDQIDRALTYIREQTPYTQTRTSVWEFRRLTVAELRAEITRRGLSAPSKARKDDLVTLLVSQAENIRPNIYPAWFHHGDVLVLPRGAGDAFGEVVDKLIDAAEHGTLAIGGLGTVNPFGSGLTLYDERDLGKITRKEISDANDWHWTQMATLDPVKTELKSRGIDCYFLGDPRLDERDGEKVVVYWLNGHGGYGNPQPFGWYTAEELLAEKFVADAREKASSRD